MSRLELHGQMAPEILTLESGRPPKFVDRYAVVATLDTAGIAHVYLAWDGKVGRWVSVKILSTKWARDTRVRSRFRNECETLRHIDHHGVLKVLDCGLDHPFTPYLVTEVAEGGHIGAWIADNGPMEPYLAIHVMAMLCSALDSAHLAGVEHAELGAEHILIDRHGSLKLNGFRGTSSFGDSVNGFNDTVDAAEILYFVLTGQRYNASLGVDGLAEIDPVLAPIVEKGTRRKRSGDRYAGVMALSRDLEAAVLRLPIPESPVRVLTSEDSWLPDDWMQCFDPAEDFADLKLAKRMMDDPDFVPDTAEVDLYEHITKMQTHVEGVEPSPEPAPEAQKYRVPDGPLYQEIEERESEEWKRIRDVVSIQEERVVPSVEPPVQAKGGVSGELLAQAVVLAMALGLVVGMITIGVGAFSVRSARIGHDAAGAELVKVVTDEGSVVYSLSAKDIDRSKIEALYFSFSDAPESQKMKHAQAFASLVVSEAKRSGVDPLADSGPVDQTEQSVARMDKTLRYYDVKRAAWAESTQRFPGSLVAMIGLARSPD